jgi:hypothetical protein
VGTFLLLGGKGSPIRFFHRGRKSQVSLELELELGWYEPRGTKFIVDSLRSGGVHKQVVAGRFAHVICAKCIIDVPSLYRYCSILYSLDT